MWLVAVVLVLHVWTMQLLMSDAKRSHHRDWKELNNYYLSLIEKYNAQHDDPKTTLHPHALVSSCRNLKKTGYHKHSRLEFDFGWLSCVPDYTEPDWIPFPFGNKSGTLGKLCYSSDGLNTSMGLCSDIEALFGKWPFRTRDCYNSMRNTNTWFNENISSGCFESYGGTYCQHDKLKDFYSDCFKERKDGFVFCLPKFINLGYHKTGTSTQYQVLRKQRGWAPWVVKEVNFWKVSSGHIKNPAFPEMQTYIRSVKGDDKDVFFGDFSVSYTFFFTAPIYVKHVMPNAKFTIPLRDPVEVLVSFFFFSQKEKSLDELAMSVYDEAIAMKLCQENSTFLKTNPKKIWDPLCFFQTLSNVKMNLLQNIMVLDSLLPWFSYFPRKSFHFMTTDRTSDPNSYRELYEFLEMPPERFNASNVTLQNKNENRKNIQTIENSTVELSKSFEFLRIFNRFHSLRLSKVIDIPIEKLYSSRS